MPPPAGWVQPSWRRRRRVRRRRWRCERTAPRSSSSLARARRPPTPQWPRTAAKGGAAAASFTRATRGTRSSCRAPRRLHTSYGRTSAFARPTTSSSPPAADRTSWGATLGSGSCSPRERSRGGLASFAPSRWPARRSAPRSSKRAAAATASQPPRSGTRLTPPSPRGRPSLGRCVCARRATRCGAAAAGRCEWRRGRSRQRRSSSRGAGSTSSRPARRPPPPTTSFSPRATFSRPR
mmetsp:Transcript_43905/g.142468  ORF Transcript_43905/g.142468 Transcript_43905/m.142468 type:complete len:237 (-) Transcript_43905:311-1021(-)